LLSFPINAIFSSHTTHYRDNTALFVQIFAIMPAVIAVLLRNTQPFHSNYYQRIIINYWFKCYDMSIWEDVFHLWQLTTLSLLFLIFLFFIVILTVLVLFAFHFYIAS